MRIYLPDAEAYFQWLDAQGYAYVILRGFFPFEAGFPGAGSKHDIDMLVEDRAVAAIAGKYGAYGKAQGTPCDVYDVSTPSEGVCLKRPYYPAGLARQILDTRRLWKGRFYTPDALRHALALVYHRLYRKKYPKSGIVYTPETLFLGGGYAEELAVMLAESGESFSFTAEAMENFLSRHGWAIRYTDMAGALQDFAMKRYHGYFYAKRCASMKGEVRLFIAGRKKDVEVLAKKYSLLAEKRVTLKEKISALARFFPIATGRMFLPFLRARWVAVMYDADPVRDASAKNPFAFYAHRDGVATALNEAQALSLLPLFFTVEEQKALCRSIEVLRGQS